MLHFSFLYLRQPWGSRAKDSLSQDRWERHSQALAWTLGDRGCTGGGSPAQKVAVGEQELTGHLFDLSVCWTGDFSIYSHKQTPQQRCVTGYHPQEELPLLNRSGIELSDMFVLSPQCNLVSGFRLFQLKFEASIRWLPLAKMDFCVLFKACPCPLC